MDGAPIAIFPECRDCILGLVAGVAGMLQQSGISLEPGMQARCERIIADAYVRGWTSPETANRIIREIRSVSGVDDPYQRFKRDEMQQARHVFGQMENRISPDLRSKAAVAVLGNSLDFFTSPQAVLKSLPAALERDFSFYRDDIFRLEERLDAGIRRVLYFTDNSGEVFFDLPLYRWIRERVGQVVLVVKGGPSLNDLTRAELEREQLTGHFDAIADTGIDGVGIDWDRTSRAFRELVDAADLIVSKGMANFETLYGRRIPPAVFFLFKAKCRPIQDFLGMPANSYCALWQAGGRM